MKVVHFLATLVAGVLAVSVFTLQVQAQGGVPRPTAPQRPSGTNVAVIDIPHIFKNHQRFNAAMEDIKKDIQAFEEFVRQEQKKGAAENEKLKNYNPGSREYRQIEEGMARLQSDLQVQTALKRKDFMEREAKLYYNAYREIEEHVAEFADRNQIGLVLRFSSEQMDPQDRQSIMQGVSRAVVFQRNLNITEYILDRLNRGAAPPNLSTPHIPRPQSGVNR